MTFLKWRPSGPARIASATVVAIFLSVTCGPNENGTSQRCEYSTSGNWPVLGVFAPNNPASCPITTPPGGRSQNYTALASVYNGQSTGTGNLIFLDYNSNGATQSAFFLHTPGTPFDSYLFTGEYIAGRVAPPSGSMGRDIAQNQIGIPGGIATATTFLTYQPTVAAAIEGAEYLDPGQYATLSGEYYQSDLLPPISYQWYQGGTLLSGETGTTLQVQGGAPNSVANYQFHVTDSENRTISASRNVVTTAGCGAQLEC